ncbi:MAG TPA: type II secretion system F family protein [Terrimesophilobacter sp.]|nr:type II secretion system F family protein [Terrimesophilobacter sp.]
MVRVSGMLGWAIVCGAALGLGLWSLVSLTPALGRPRLVSRIAPYLGDVSEQARAMTPRRPSGPLPVLGSLLAPLGESVRIVVDRMLGGSDTIELRLRQSGSQAAAAEFRMRQLAWALGGLGIGAVLAIIAAQTGRAPTIALVALVGVAGVGGFVARDWLLQRAAKARLARVASELPTVLEFLTLSLAAGEGILDSIRRVSGRGNGELSAEFTNVSAQVAAGVPLARALTELADGIRLPALTRCIEQVTGALDRGTPLVETLRAQAQDARDQAKRALLEVAGRKEVGMLMPLVFLILPTTIVFAIFPGIFVLQLGF